MRWRNILKYVTLCLLIIVLLSAVSQAFAEAASTSAAFGATGGNLQNSGVWNQQPDALYGLMVLDGKPGLCRQGNDGTVTLLAPGYVSQVNVLDGMVYYIALTSPTKDTGVIFRVPADGSAPAWQMTMEKSLFLLVMGDSLYFTLDEGGYLYTMKADGSGRRPLLKNKCGKLDGDGNYLYFQDETNKTLSRFDPATGEVTGMKLSYSGYGQMENGVFYYRDSKKRLCSVKADGSGNLILFDGAIDGLNAEKGRLYFVNKKDKGHPYSMKIDGSGLLKLADQPADYLLTVGEDLFLISKGKGLVYRLGADGTLTRLQ